MMASPPGRTVMRLRPRLARPRHATSVPASATDRSSHDSLHTPTIPTGHGAASSSRTVTGRGNLWFHRTVLRESGRVEIPPGAVPSDSSDGLVEPPHQQG